MVAATLSTGMTVSINGNDNIAAPDMPDLLMPRIIIARPVKNQKSGTGTPGRIKDSIMKLGFVDFAGGIGDAVGGIARIDDERGMLNNKGEVEVRVIRCNEYRIERCQ